eukprot:CAMPEP_0194548798 /NCGR_PEP_ID=MMETSP0253-20130528/94197_1 /TAXON_ID=2966 /ORGANISM="Noctiluca scintillans" /LENGTH=145 /DNA_ID=CAMNT_0039396151 /DNA_START=77 /DNA_END=514 /DNA_ORIENTATION=+
MTKEQFFQLGCPCCRDVLNMQENEGRVVACTTTLYQGIMAVIKPGSFATRFNGLDKRRPGCYALAVQGTIPEHILNEPDLMDDDLEECAHSPKRRRGGGSFDGSVTPATDRGPMSPSLGSPIIGQASVTPHHRSGGKVEISPRRT